MNREQWFSFWIIMMIVIKMIRAEDATEFNALVKDFEWNVQKKAPGRW